MNRPIFSPEVIRLHWGRMSPQMQEAYEEASAALRVAAIRATDEILTALDDEHERELESACTSGLLAPVGDEQ